MCYLLWWLFLRENKTNAMSHRFLVKLKNIENLRIEILCDGNQNLQTSNVEKDYVKVMTGIQ